MYLGDSNRQPQICRENLEIPRPILPSQKAWLEMASDNNSRIFTNLLPRNILVEFFVYCVCPQPSYKHSFERSKYGS